MSLNKIAKANTRCQQLYRPSLLTSPLECILSPHSLDVCKFLLDGQHWRVHMYESICILVGWVWTLYLIILTLWREGHFQQNTCLAYLRLGRSGLDAWFEFGS